MYFFIEADALDARFTKQGAALNTMGQEGFGPPIRRPYRGIQIKKDTYSFLSIYSGNVPISMKSESVNPGHGQGAQGMTPYYADFILQSINDDRSEKMQVIETFGEPYVYFYGEKPRVVTFSGVLINTEDFNWRSQFWYNYDNYMRGTKLVQRNARAYLAYDSIVVEGYPISASAADSSDNPYSIPFRMTMLLTNYHDYSNIGETEFPPGKITQATLDLVNQELATINKNRSEFVSTTAQVRLKNLSNKPRSGVAAALRTGMRATGNVLTTVQGISKSLGNFLGGRNVRVPVGIAGFISQVGFPVYGAGSVTQDMLTVYDSKTGKYKTLTGSLVLKMPSMAGFTNNGKPQDRGSKWDNWDEYPYREDEKPTIESILGGEGANQIQLRIAKRNSVLKKIERELMFYDLQSSLSQIMSDINSLSGMANALSAQFGLIKSTLDFKTNPLGVLRARANLGLGNLSKLSQDLFADPFNSAIDVTEAVIKSRTDIIRTNMETLMAPIHSVLNSPTVISDFKDKLSAKFDELSDTLKSELGSIPATMVEEREKLTSEFNNVKQSIKSGTEKVLGAGSTILRSAEYIRNTFKDEGIKETTMASASTQDKSNTVGLSRSEYVGNKARTLNQSFEALAEAERVRLDLFGDPEAEVDVGVVYENSEYLEKSTDMDYRRSQVETADYEAIYRNSNYSPLETLHQLEEVLGTLDEQAAAAAGYLPPEYASAMVRPAAAAAAIQAVREAYDDALTEQESEIGEQEIEAVYGTGYSSSQARDPRDILALLQKMREVQNQTNEQAIGIRGVDDEDTQIDPVK